MRKVLSLLLLLLPALILSTALPSRQKPQKKKCKNPAIRREWRKLTIPERQSFIQALLCLHKTPAARYSHMPGTYSEFEAFTTVHKLQTPYIHFTGIFLPWHRIFLAEFEHTLQTTCNYTGTLPYWDYTLDSRTTPMFPNANISHSPVFDPNHGFGGNGIYNKTMNDALTSQGTFWGGGCVRDGPFKDWIFHVAPQWEWYEDSRCLKRNIWEVYEMWTTSEREYTVMQQTNFTGMQKYLEGFGMDWVGLHGGGHMVVGGLPHGVGTANDPWTSSLEPLFYLHHANIDRVWDKWQRKRREYKWDVTDARMDREDKEVWGPGFVWEEAPMTMESRVNMTEEYVEWWGARVGEIWDIEGSLPEEFDGEAKLCYRYA
ncbi:Di-copper centre-containing protein [Ascobolus immersus RN42]|uniref:Di-copper centre-containing protein n=1 Tax=Ascobolus immersus RN42 TaxID=1160509 RepID=A0A3N4IE98_ASCIM|nr:Di-copper centre-containing protein [Ascobolus immersus RN42]